MHKRIFSIKCFILNNKEGRMKRSLIFATLIALGFYGCAGGARYIDTSSTEYVSSSLDLNDIKKASKESLESLFRSGYYNKIDVNNPVVLAVSDFINDTTIKLDMEQITARIVEELQNTGKFLITRAISGSGGSTDSMIDKSRQARDDEEYDQNSVVEKGEKLAVSASLSGKVGQRITRVGSDQRVDYFFKIEIVNTKNGISVWSKTIDISKISSGNSSVW